MYARPENRLAHDTLWRAIAAKLRDDGIAAPENLDHTLPHDAIWGRADMVLGQVCNLPLCHGLGQEVTVIGTGDYGLEGTEPGYYHSVYVVRRDDPAQCLADCAGYQLAVNDLMSHSGWGSIYAEAHALGMPLGPPLETGAHRESLAAIVQGRADFAAIDAQSWWMDRNSPQAQACRVIGRTAATPGQSFITAGHVNPAPYFNAIAHAIADLPRPMARVLGMRGIVCLPPSAYNLPFPPQPAQMRSTAA